MEEITPNWIHKELVSIGGTHILTSNYEYTLEAAGGVGRGKAVDFSSETRYSLFRCREVRSKRIWHIHGEIDKPETIMLGYEQYVGYLYKARNYLTLDSKRQSTGAYDYRSPVIHGRYNFEERTDSIYSWIDIFLRDDVHMVGFTCDYSEIDIWWLLGLKERLRQNDRRVAKGINVGRTVFYYFRPAHLSSRLQGQLAALTNFGVECVPVAVKGSYEEAWRKLCDMAALIT